MDMFSVLVLTATPPGLGAEGGGAYMKIDGREAILRSVELFLNRDNVKQVQVVFLPDEADCPAFVNADLIAAGLSPFNPEVVAMRAGRLTLELIDEHVSARGQFCIRNDARWQELRASHPGLAGRRIPRDATLFGVAVRGGSSSARS